VAIDPPVTGGFILFLRREVRQQVAADTRRRTVERILVINPGATSTKFAVFDDESVRLKQTLEHHGAELANYSRSLTNIPIASA
jgi:uncharacterized protein (DUF1786 family)